jgi:hypothetical protein
METITNYRWNILLTNDLKYNRTWPFNMTARSSTWHLCHMHMPCINLYRSLCSGNVSYLMISCARTSIISSPDLACRSDILSGTTMFVVVRLLNQCNYCLFRILWLEAGPSYNSSWYNWSSFLGHSESIKRLRDGHRCVGAI